MIPPSEQSSAIEALEARVEFLTAILESLYRAGILTDAALAEVERRFSCKAHMNEGSDTREKYAGLVIASQLFALRANAVPGETEAERRRRDMRDRTRFIERKAQEKDR